MSTNRSEGPAQVFDASVAAINLALRDIQRRLDAMKGLNGRVMVYDRIRAEDPTDSQDVVTLGRMQTLEAQPFVTVASSATLTAERVLTGEATVITLTDAGANSTVTISLTANGVTFAKIQQVSTDRLVGRDTAGTGNLEQLTVGNGLEFTGAGGIGVASNGITDARLRDSAAVSVIGRSANSSGDPADIAAGANGNILRRASNAVGFGAIDLADGTNAVSGILATANGGTGTSSSYGTYTPTLTNVSNLDSSTAYPAQWLRVGNTVTVSGRVTVDKTATATLTEMGISLPVASNFTAFGECGGTINGLYDFGAIAASAASDRAEAYWTANVTSSDDMYFTFTYVVL